ncbi:cysteine synthase family protein [Fulvimarina sp. 2208YS6-2-32]|uniref:Cysteine synthase family protein n=1 Tax=Fulvimarina uroteuthidis TaxID=3098149 RepID=A0ABU5I5F1_9HYPH|nr:cysteine synthase family protein [Fulvimarina sp. 2208YS6-2-32]MDY8110322.1 cysteine synthase family protein [Fulvimarina sp. 2208YS6-2-32]
MAKRTTPSHPGSALDTIGNTPVVELTHVVPEGAGRVFVKLECFNPTGSYKDRMARTIIEGAERRGDLRPGVTVVEASGGSTGSSLAFVCAVKGHAFHLVSSNAFAREKLATVKAFGATVELINSPTGQITADLIPRMIERARELSRDEGYLFTDQFTNSDSLEGYRGIGQELLDQVPGDITAFCGAVGIGGMLVGTGQVLKAAGADTKIVLLEPASSPVFTAGVPGTHHVEGIGIGFVPALLNEHPVYDEVRAIDETEARAMCRRLAGEEGIFAGTSTGLNVVAAVALAKELGPDATIVTVACDSGLKYLNGSLYS